MTRKLGIFHAQRFYCLIIFELYLTSGEAALPPEVLLENSFKHMTGVIIVIAISSLTAKRLLSSLFGDPEQINLAALGASTIGLMDL